MSFLNFRNKMDKTIAPYIDINSKRKIPTIVGYRGNSKFMRNKILHFNGSIKYSYDNVPAFACDFSPLSAEKISELPETTYVTFDYKASLCLRKASEQMNFPYNNPSKLTGRDIGIGLIDSGVFPHPDLNQSRDTIKYFYDLINLLDHPYDDNGHGTFLSGCIASSGKASGNLYRGIAPNSELYTVKAFDAVGKGFLSDIVKGIDMLMNLSTTTNIRLLCLPFEFVGIENNKLKPLTDIIKTCVAKGLSVITPAGNSGPKPYTIYCPGNMSEVITVGGTSSLNASPKTLRTSTFSGRGPTINNIQKPDLCAPACSITSLASNIDYLPGATKFANPTNFYTNYSGTSISCALLTGFAALLLEKTPSLTPADLKSILSLLTTSYGESKFSQGSGLFTFSKLS